MTDGSRRFERSIVAICAAMMLLGIAVRFTFLDTKIFGNDEATTSLHVSGKTIVQYADAMFDGRIRTVKDILVFQQPDPLHGVGDVVRSLAIEDPQHPPFYYVLERQWEMSAGSSIAARRLLAALFGAISIAAAVWLGFELYSPIAGILSGALVAVSPFAIAYSQVAREYSLWMALTFGASALFVRAVRRERVTVWLAYIIVSVAGLYTDALFSLVVVAHALVAAILSPGRRALSFGFAASLVVMVAAYVPWISALTYGYTHGIVTNNAYLSAGLSLKPFLLKWLFNIGTLFYDADYIYPKSAVLIIPGLVALALAFVTCARLLRQKPQMCIIFSLAAVALAALVGPDLLHHEQRSTASRYLIPLWVACYAALGVGLASALRSREKWIRRTSMGMVLFTAATGLGSLAVSARHDTWWVDGSTAPIGPIARAIERTQNPLVVFHSTWGPGRQGPEVWDFAVVMVADVLRPSTPVVQYGRDEPLAMPARSGGQLLLLDPNDAALTGLRAHGNEVVKVAGGDIPSTSTELAALRQTVSREREHQGAVSRMPTPSLWSVHER